MTKQQTFLVGHYHEEADVDVILILNSYVTCIKTNNIKRKVNVRNQSSVKILKENISKNL